MKRLVAILALGMILCGCGDSRMKSNDDAFTKLCEESMEALKLQTKAHMAWGIDKIDRWDVDQIKGEIVFTTAEGAKAIASVQIIGSYNLKDHTWLWAWANSSIQEDLKADSYKAKAFGQQKGFSKLTTDKWIGTEEEAWDMAAVANRLCERNGVYRGPAGDLRIFMTFGEIALTKKD
jgi:hypothetical protein